MEHRLSSLTSQIVQPETLIAKPEKNRLFIDVHLGDREDELKSYRDCHIHGAVYAQIRDVFAGPPTADSGNLPLPRIYDLERQLKLWQVDNETELVLYGPSMALAARGWWILRWAGLSRVKVLDGGLRSWANAGGAVAQGEYIPARRPDAGSLVLHTGNMPSVSVSEIDNLSRDAVLLDARDETSYLSGHIPRAKHLAASEFWTPASNLRTVSEITDLYESAGVVKGVEPVVYCGGGVLSALSVLTLTALGIPARLFVGSWSEWCKSPDRMAKSEVGEEIA